MPPEGHLPRACQIYFSQNSFGSIGFLLIWDTIKSKEKSAEGMVSLVSVVRVTVRFAHTAIRHLLETMLDNDEMVRNQC
eukprot:746640-Hanusia_phi.AAC.1